MSLIAACDAASLAMIGLNVCGSAMVAVTRCCGCAAGGAAAVAVGQRRDRIVRLRVATGESEKEDQQRRRDAAPHGAPRSRSTTALPAGVCRAKTASSSAGFTSMSLRVTPMRCWLGGSSICSWVATGTPSTVV